MTFTPAYELVAGPRTLELSNPRSVFFLHGALGSGRNWRSFARAFVDAAPDWRAVLVDLPYHGDSAPAPGPPTIAGAAAHVAALATELGEPHWIAGHSLGGRIALQLLDHLRPERLWLLDSPPAGRAETGDEDASPWPIAALLRRVPIPIPSRNALVETMREAGFDETTARWMTTNLRSVDGGYDWRFDLDGIDGLMRDFARTDLWRLLEDPPAGVVIDAVLAEKSDVWSPDSRARLEELAGSGQIALTTLDAGHWLHVDDPKGLLTLFLDRSRADVRRLAR